MNAPPSTPGRPRGFLARWSQRKLRAQVRTPESGAIPVIAQPMPTGPTPAIPPASAPPGPASAMAAATQTQESIAAPATLEELAALDHTADLRRFVAAGVDETVRRAALRKIFQDPRFNVMDGLDTYIDNYNAPSPVPASMLERIRRYHAAALAGSTPPGALPRAGGQGAGAPRAVAAQPAQGDADAHEADADAAGMAHEAPSDLDDAQGEAKPA